MAITIDGSNGIDISAGNLTFPDNTTQTTAPTSIGVGQTWQNVTSSRAQNVTYTNSTGKPIMIAVSLNPTNGGGSISVNGNIILSGFGVSGYGAAGLSAIVPNNATYMVSGASGFSNWQELR